MRDHVDALSCAPSESLERRTSQACRPPPPAKSQPDPHYSQRGNGSGRQHQHHHSLNNYL